MIRKCDLYRRIGDLLCVVAPIVFTLMYFPLWKTNVRMQVSGFGVIMIIVATTALRNKIKAWMKSPTPWILYIVLMCLLIAVSNIIKPMITVLAMSSICAAVGEVFYILGRREAKKAEGMKNA